MTEYTVVKVSDVPDQSANLGHDPEQFEIRFMRNDLGCEHCGVSFARYSKGFAADGHTHNRQEEIYLLVSGRAQALVAFLRRPPGRFASSATRTRSSSRSARRTPAPATVAACRKASAGRTDHARAVPRLRRRRKRRARGRRPPRRRSRGGVRHAGPGLLRADAPRARPRLL
jgi:hypothetical protein